MCPGDLVWVRGRVGRGSPELLPLVCETPSSSLPSVPQGGRGEGGQGVPGG